MKDKERWGSRLGLILAMAGNAVGLGNFLRFPAQAAKYGGGAYLLPYLLALVLLGLPLMWVEWAMGRFGGRAGEHAPPGIFQAHAKHPLWKYFGTLGLWINLVIAGFYLYLEAWCLAYACYALVGGFRGTDLAGVADFYSWLTGARDHQLWAFTWPGVLCFAICIVLNIWILSRGLVKGIELVSKYGLPLLILFALVLAVRGLLIDPATDPQAKVSPLVGLNFVWQPRLGELGDPAVWLSAAGQVFFSLAIGFGSIHCYASYMRDRDDLVLAGSTTVWTNEFCEVVLGGTILLPIAVAYLGMEFVSEKVAGGSGLALGFKVFPVLFENWGAFAPVAGFLWFGLLFFAALTSSLAMGQPILSFFQQDFGMPRKQSAWTFGILLTLLAIPVALFTSATFFDEFDFWGGTVGLVVFALVEVILFAWVFGMDKAWSEIHLGAEMWIPKLFYYVIKYVTPLFLLLILLSSIFKTDPDLRTYWQKSRAGEPVQLAWAGDGLIGTLLHRDIDKERRKISADTTLDPEHRDSRLRYWDQVQTTRNYDRLLLLLLFVGFCYLVRLSWQRRAAQTARNVS